MTDASAVRQDVIGSVIGSGTLVRRGRGYGVTA
jgi:hypothetical protein